MQRAAARLRTAVKQGYEWALKADFRAFFDSIDHRELAQRLQVYVGDDELSKLIMAWIKSGSPYEHRGVPTGAPVSPVVSNMFLDVFDESIKKTGGFLVRYADDFLILYRTQTEAEQAHEAAQSIATSICLELNATKTSLVDIKEPFEFLGFQFFYREHWEVSELTKPIRIRDLGWKKKSKARSDPQFVPLPGESQIDGTSHESTVICGPNVSRLDSQGSRLLVRFSDGTLMKSLPLDRLREIVLIGIPDLSRHALSAMTRHNISWYLIDSFGNPRGNFVVNDPVDSYRAIIAQAEASVSPTLCLSVAKQLIQSKLLNYAALAKAIPGRYRDYETAKRLVKYAGQTFSTDSVDELMGIEGVGAARWYGSLSGRLGGGFVFEKRIAPDAWDPVNAMLNVGQTMLHHFITQVIQLVGLAPTVGLMHSPRAGHSTLASDMQEPFRHLVDRTVLETLGELRKQDFQSTVGGKHPLKIKPRAMKLLIRNFHLVLGMNCQSVGQPLARPYRMQILTQVRSLKRFMSEPEKNEFQTFTHP